MDKLFGIIFVKENDNYIFLKKTTISTDENGEYLVEDKFLSEREYTYLKGPSNFIDENGIALHAQSSKKYAVYVFPNEYIDKIMKEEDLSEDEAIQRIFNKSRKIVLTGSIYIPGQYTSLIKQNTLNDSDITRLLGTEASYFQNIAPGILLATKRMMNSKNIQSINKAPYTLDGIDVNKIISEISAKIVGQEETIRSVVCNIYLNQLLISSLDGNENISNELDSRKVGILLDGATGTGKTAIAREIAAKLKLPIVKVDANSFSETGYVGATITDILADLVKEADGDIELASRGIVVLDEIDKIARKNDYDSSSMKLGVQKELLGFMSGSVYDLDSSERLYGGNDVTKFDTSKLTFILSGAFTDMKDSKIKENSNIGFNTNNERLITYSVDTEDYIDYGLMREFFGRIKVISYLKSYSIEDLKNILLNSSISPLKGFNNTCMLLGYPGIEYDDDFINAVAARAYIMGTNARALQTIISSIQNIILFDLINGVYDKTKKIKLDLSLLYLYI